jgi:hypothetical protein
MTVKVRLDWRHLLAITPTIATTCLGHLGQRDRDRIISIFCYIAQGGQGQAQLHVAVAVDGIIMLKFTNGNTS